MMRIKKGERRFFCNEMAHLMEIVNQKESDQSAKSA